LRTVAQRTCPKKSPSTKCTILPFGILLHCNLGRDSWIARRRNTPWQLYGRRTEELRSVEFLFWGARRWPLTAISMSRLAERRPTSWLGSSILTPFRSDRRGGSAGPRCSMRRARGARAPPPACRLTDAVAPVPVPASYLTPVRQARRAPAPPRIRHLRRFASTSAQILLGHKIRTRAPGQGMVSRLRAWRWSRA
jgi:hypothetical protein